MKRTDPWAGDDGWPCHLVATGNHSGTKDEQIAKWGPDYVESLYEAPAGRMRWCFQ